MFPSLIKSVVNGPISPLERETLMGQGNCPACPTTAAMSAYGRLPGSPSTHSRQNRALVALLPQRFPLFSTPGRRTAFFVLVGARLALASVLDWVWHCCSPWSGRRTYAKKEEVTDIHCPGCGPYAIDRSFQLRIMEGKLSEREKEFVQHSMAAYIREQQPEIVRSPDADPNAYNYYARHQKQRENLHDRT